MSHEMEQEYFSVVQSVSRKHDNTMPLQIEQVLKVDIEAILAKIQSIETKVSESRTEKLPNWALLLQSRLDNIEKTISLQQIKSTMTKSRLNSAKVGIEEDDDDNEGDKTPPPPMMSASGAASGKLRQNMPGQLTHQKSMNRLQEISSDDRLYEKLRLEIESHSSSAQMSIESKMGTLSLEIDRLNKLLQSRPSTSDIQKIIKNITDINQKVEQSVQAATEQVRIEMQESGSEEMKGVIDYVRKQEDLHQENMRALMNKIDHSNRDSTSTRQLAESSFEYIQKHMTEVVEDNEETKAKLQKLEDEIASLQSHHNETMVNLLKYQQYQDDRIVIDDEMKKKLISLENSVEVLSSADSGIDALIIRLDEKLSGESQAMKILQQQLSEIENHAKELDGSLLKLQSDIEVNVKDAIKETNNIMTERLNVLNNQFTQAIQNDKIESQKSIQALELLLEKHTLELNTLDTKQSTEIDSLKNHIQLVEDDIVKKTQSQLDQLIETTKKQMETFNASTKNNKVAITDLYSKLSDVHESLNEHQTFIHTLESNQLIKHNVVMEEITLINDRIDTVSHKVNKMDSNTETLIESIQGHDERILNLKVAIERCEDDLSTAYSEIRLHLITLIEDKTIEMDEKFDHMNNLLSHLVKEKGGDTSDIIENLAVTSATSANTVTAAANISSKHPFTSNNRTSYLSQKATASSSSSDQSPRHNRHHSSIRNQSNDSPRIYQQQTINRRISSSDFTKGSGGDGSNNSIGTSVASPDIHSISIMDNNTYHSGIGNNSRACTGQDLRKIFEIQSRIMADLCLNFEEVAVEKSFLPPFSHNDCECMAVTAQEISEMIAIYADNEAIKFILRQKPGAIDNNHNNIEECSIPERRGRKIEEFMKETAFLVTQMNGQPGLIRLDARERFFKQLQKVLDIAISKHDQILVVGTSSLGRLKIPTCIACNRPLADKARRSDAVVYADTINATAGGVPRYQLYNNQNNPETGNNSPSHNNNNNNSGGTFPSLHHSASSPSTAVLINNNNNSTNSNSGSMINRNLSPILNNRTKSAQSGIGTSSNTNIPGQLKAMPVRASYEQ